MKFIIAYVIACTAVTGLWCTLVFICERLTARREAAYNKLLRDKRAEMLAREVERGDEVAAQRGRIAFRVQNGSLPTEAASIIPSPETEVANLRRAGVL